MEKLDLGLDSENEVLESVIDNETFRQTLLKTIDGGNDPEFLLYTGENLLESMRETNAKLRSIVAIMTSRKNLL